MQFWWICFFNLMLVWFESPSAKNDLSFSILADKFSKLKGVLLYTNSFHVLWMILAVKTTPWYTFIFCYLSKKLKFLLFGVKINGKRSISSFWWRSSIVSSHFILFDIKLPNSKRVKGEHYIQNWYFSPNFKTIIIGEILIEEIR